MKFRTRLLAGVTLALPGTAFAQAFPDRAFQAGSTVVSGSAVINRTATADTVTLDTLRTVINWNPEATAPFPPPPAGAINLLPANRSITFVNSPGLNAPYVVLNRIIAPSSATRQMAINGTVESRFGAVAGVPAPIGGTVWFYTPGGFIIGSNAVFNVGNLVLTANDIDTTGGLFGPGGQIRFRGALTSTAAVTVNPGAQFNLPNVGSYLAMVAPTVNMGGTATVNGSVGYIAAQQADVTINAGLFDIGFIAGTDNANAITHSGTTTGPAQGPNGQIVFAAVGKNTAISMLLSGSIGYTPAATATVQNGTVLLLAGYDTNQFAGPVNATAANITIGNGAFTSEVKSRATGTLLAAPTAGLSFSSNAELDADTSSTLRAAGAATITVGGDLAIVSRSADGATGGNAALSVLGAGPQPASITIAGTTTIDARGIGLPGSVGGNGSGGIASITLDNGRIQLGGAATVFASGTGGPGLTQGGIGTGGTATVALSNAIGGGRGLIATGLTIDASGVGGGAFQLPPAGFIGGNGSGGTASMTVTNADATATDLLLAAGAVGARADATGTGGDAAGGAAGFNQTGGTVALDSLALDASARFGLAGSGGVSGTSQGGLATGVIAAGIVQIVRAIDLNADGAFEPALVGPGPGPPPLPGALRSATGGTAQLSVAGTLDAAGADARISAQGLSTAGTGTSPGDARGGTATLDALTGGAVTLAGLIVDASADGGKGASGSGTGVSAVGGTAGVTVDDAVVGIGANALTIVANGIGGPGGEGPTAAAGGSGIGGIASFDGNGGTITTPSIFVNADGFGGNGGNGSFGDGGGAGDATGGIARFTNAASQLNLAIGLTVTSRATGGNGGSNIAGASATSYAGGAGGSATARNATVGITGGNANIGSYTIDTLAIGGAGGSGADGGVSISGLAGGAGGSATGGNGLINLTTVTGASRSIVVVSDAIGGAGGFGEAGGSGGIAQGGTARATITDVPTLANGLILAAVANGGNAGASGSGTSANGGAGTGGTATLSIAGNGSAFTLGGNVFQFVVSTGATGGTGGNAGSLLANATGGNGGTALGGTASASASNGVIDIASVPEFIFGSSAQGGNGGAGANGGAGGNGGAGTGGAVTVTSSGTDAIVTIGNFATFTSDGTGGNGGLGGTGNLGTTGAGGATGSPGAPGGIGGTGAQGGDGGTGGDGGIGTGGNVSFIAQDGGRLTGTIATLASAGQGGSGGQGGIGGEGGGGGTGGSGGSGQFGFNGGTGGTGGNGGQGGTGGFGGLAAAGNGGVVRLAAIGGSVAFDQITTTASGSTGDLALPSIGGAGGRAGSGGTGGGALLPGVPGASGAIGNIGPTGFENTGFSFALSSGGGILFESLTNAAGDPGSFDIGTGSATVDSLLDGISGGGGSFGNITVRNSGPASALQSLRFGTLGLIAGDAAAPDPSGSIDIIADNNLVSIPFSATARTSGDIRLTANGSGQIATTGNALFAAGGSVIVSHNAGTGGPTVSGDTRTQFSALADIIVNSGARVTGTGDVELVAADDVIVRAGGSVSAGGTLLLAAGGVPLPFALPAGDIRSLIVDGSIMTPGTLEVAAEAVQIGGSVTAAAIAIDLFNVPPPGVLGSDDGGQLSGICRGGTVCTGTLTATGDVRIGPANGNTGLPGTIRLTGNVSGSNVSLRARDAFALTLPAPFEVTGRNVFLEVVSGSIDFTPGGSVSAIDSATIVAGGGITIPSIRSQGIIVLGGQSVSAGTIDADLGLFTWRGANGTPDPFIEVAGSFTATNLLRTGSGDIDVRAGGAITVGTADSSGADVLLTSSGSDIDVGGTGGAGANNVVLSARSGSVGFGTLVAGNGITIDAGANVLGGFANGGSFTSRSGGLTAFCDIFANGGTVNIGAAQVNGGTLDGFNIILNSGGIRLGTARTTSSLEAIASGDVRIDTIDSGGSVFVSGDTLTLGTADAGDALTLFATGASTYTRIAGNGVDITTASLTGGAIDSDANVAVSAVSGNITSGNITAGGSIDLVAFSAGGSTTAGNLTAGTYIEVRGDVSASVGNVTAGTDFAIDVRPIGAGAGSTTVGTVTAGDDILISGLTVQTGNLRSTGLGSDTTVGLPTTFAGAGPTGRVVRLFGATSIVSGDIVTPDRVILYSSNGTAQAGDITAPQAVMTFTRGDLTLGSVATSGYFYADDSSLYIGNAAQLLSIYNPNLLESLGGVISETAGSLTLTGPVTAGDVVVKVGGFARLPAGMTAQRSMFVRGRTGTTGTNFNAGSSLGLVSDGNIGVMAISAGADLQIFTPTGSITATSVTGGSVQLTGGTIATGAITSGADALVFSNIGDIVTGEVTAGGDAIVSTLSTATGGVTTGNVTAGLSAEVAGRGSVLAGNVTAGNDADIRAGAAGGTTTLRTGNVTAGDDVWVSNFGNAAADTLVAGTLRSTGTGSDSYVSPSSVGTGADGRIVRVRSSGSLIAGDIFTPDRAILVADRGAVATGNIQATNGIGLLAVTNINAGTLTTSGTLAVANSAQFVPVVVPSYDPATLHAGAATPISGAFTPTGPITAGTVFVRSESASLGTVATTDRVDVATAGNIAFATVNAQGAAALSGVAGTVTGTTLTSGGAVAVSGANGVTIDTLTTPGTAILNAPNGTVRIATNIAAGSGVSASARDVILRATGALTTGNLLATSGDLDVRSAGNLVAASSGATGTVTLTSTGGSVVANAVGTNSEGATGNAVITGSTNVTIGTANVSTALAVRAGGVATFDNLAVARTIDVASRDIAIGTNATLGRFGTTTTLTLANSGMTQTVIGGTGMSQGVYRLDAAEFLRVRANNIVIQTPLVGGPAGTAINSARTPDVLIEGFTLNGGTQLATTGTLSITNAGKVRVTGDVLLNGMAGDSGLNLRGDEAIEVQGSIVLRDANGLSGRLSLTSSNIIASTPAALAAFGTATTLQAINDRAGQSEATTPNDGGWLQAGGITANLLNSTLIIQNTGAQSTNPRNFADRRGFTVGAGGFTVVQAGANPVRVVVNGRQIGTANAAGVPAIGGFVTGIQLIPNIRIVNGQNAAGVFDQQSTANNCLIASPASCQTDLTRDNPRDVIVNYDGGASATLLPPYIIELKDYTGFIDQPLIDEPVTGSANDDLWAVDDDKCDPSTGKVCP